MTAIDQKQINKQQTNRYEKYYRQIGLNIAYYRKLRGMSQMALAEATDLSRTHISNIEAPNMKTSLSLESLFDIAGVLQVAPRALLDLKPTAITSENGHKAVLSPLRC